MQGVMLQWVYIYTLNHYLSSHAFVKFTLLNINTVLVISIKQIYMCTYINQGVQLNTHQILKS